MYPHFKRAFDVIISVALLAVLSSLILLTAVLIKIESDGPVIFRQERIGLGGRVFNLYKFRSMCVGAEQMGAGQYCVRDDFRVTKVGAVIRKLSIDELPQLVNILKGDMSLIGPRPVLTYHPQKIEEYTEEQKKRFSVRPGISGLAQINGRKNLDWNERIKFDVYYTENLSFALDIKIFFKTIFKVICASDNESTKPQVFKSQQGRVEDAEANVHNK